ncbi:MAG TPA: hypothetical protein ENJ93_03725 [Chloroflexi bacterium]|nr:hypothetical protein [Chloroflexota bacterium]
MDFGLFLLQLGHLQISRELTEKSIAIIRTIDDPPHLIIAMDVLAAIFIAENRLDEARALLQEMIETTDRLSIQWHSLLTLLADGRFAIAEGRFEDWVSCTAIPPPHPG